MLGFLPKVKNCWLSGRRIFVAGAKMTPVLDSEWFFLSCLIALHYKTRFQMIFLDFRIRDAVLKMQVISGGYS